VEIFMAQTDNSFPDCVAGSAAERINAGERLLDEHSPDSALAAFEQALVSGPDFAALHGRGIALQMLGRHGEALTDFEAALRLRPGDISAMANRGNALQDLGRHAEALESFDRVLARRPGFAQILYSRSNVLQEMNRFDEALAGYGQVLVQNPADVAALNNRGNTFTKMRRHHDALADFDAALALQPGFAYALYNRGRALCESGSIAQGLADFQRAADILEKHGTAGVASPHKARHDAEQQEWLAAAGISTPVAGPLHVEAGARLAGPAINPGNGTEVARAWRQTDPQLVVVDNLLTPEALAALRRFCWESTIWRKSYPRGYLGAFPESGFACPLLAQIAEEFRTVFPSIFSAHPLVYLWSFKYDSRLRGIEVHADQAAVNVNFWITPDEANLDPDHGGLVVWDKAAPLDWDFAKFNSDIPAARDFLERSGARPVTIFHRANRAVIFDSDLFHETDTITFREGYGNRRINCTLLYGFRDSKG
jgi:tetratricopeptide (TPR) repeat protein